MVITIWKDSKTLPVVITKMTKGVDKVTKRKGSKPITVKYRKKLLNTINGNADFIFLQGFTEWNLSVNIPDRPRRGG